MSSTESSPIHDGLSVANGLNPVDGSGVGSPVVADADGDEVGITVDVAVAGNSVGNTSLY